jgi:hypothetical protein
VETRFPEGRPTLVPSERGVVVAAGWKPGFHPATWFSPVSEPPPEPVPGQLDQVVSAASRRRCFRRKRPTAGNDKRPPSRPHPWWAASREGVVSCSPVLGRSQPLWPKSTTTVTLTLTTSAGRRTCAVRRSPA